MDEERTGIEDLSEDPTEVAPEETGAAPDEDATTNIVRRVNGKLKKADKPKLTRKELIKKITSAVVTAICVLIAVFSVTFAISAIMSSKKGYTTIAGYVYYTVMSGSMDGEPTLNDVRFAKGDVIYGKILKDDEKANLKVGDVITFWDSVSVEDGARSVRALNSHTIIARVEYPDGTVRYQTKGNNPVTNPDPDPTLRKSEDVVSIYIGKSEGFGTALLWLSSKTGFIVCVLVPSLLIVLYCLIMVIINAVNYSKKKYTISNEQIKETVKDEVTDEMRAEMRLQIMKELGINPDDDKQSDEPSPDSPDTP